MFVELPLLLPRTAIERDGAVLAHASTHGSPYAWHAHNVYTHFFPSDAPIALVLQDQVTCPKDAV